MTRESPAGAVELVERYLAALVARDWEALAATLAPDVVRNGPYGDGFHGHAEYVGFLERTLAGLHDYTMEVARVWGTEECVCAELAETVTLDGRRLRTEEAIVFDAHDGVISRVRVFLQQSSEPPA